MTNIGGTAGSGALFEYDISINTFKNLKNFITTDGTGPEGDLLQASNGKLYGMTRNGGANGDGVLFEFDLTTSTYTKLMDFISVIGRAPTGSLIQAKNAKLYGLTWLGGVNDLGTLFEYDITTNTYTKKFDFDGADHGKSPKGKLIQASNDKFYGTTFQGGLNGLGTLFEYDLATNILTKKQDMGSFGTGTVRTGYTPTKFLVERGSILGVTKLEKQFGFSFYPNPTNATISLKYNDNLSVEKIQLFNTIGGLVKVFKSSIKELDIKHLPTGLYILRVDTNKGVISKKIIKE
jgi:uncharacterized repeat protein (TIGR03803 family)